MSVEKVSEKKEINLLSAVTLLIIFAIFCYAFYLHVSIVDSEDNRNVTLLFPDSIVFWSAGRMALEGGASALFTPEFNLVQTSFFPGLMAENKWLSPPVFLFFLVPFALLSFKSGWLLWSFLCTIGYLRIIWKVLPQPYILLAALMFPPFMNSLFSGQSGALITIIFAAALLNMEKRPLLAGLCVGLLIIKPHFGILIPLMLLIEKRWTVFAAAAVSVLLLAGISVWCFGTEIWNDFFLNLGAHSDSYLNQESFDLYYLQSAIGIAQFFHFDFSLYWPFQIGWSLAAILVLIAAFRMDNLPFEVKGCVLVIATLMVNPYIMYYDFTILAFVLAVLIRQYSWGKPVVNWMNLAILLSFIALLCMHEVMPRFVKFPAGQTANLLLLAAIFHEAFKGKRAKPG